MAVEIVASTPGQTLGAQPVADAPAPEPAAAEPAPAAPALPELDPVTLKHLTKLSAENRALREAAKKAAATPAALPEDTAARLARLDAIEKATSKLEKLKLIGASYEELTEEMLQQDPGSQLDPRVQLVLDEVHGIKAKLTAAEKAEAEQAAKDEAAAAEKAKADAAAQAKGLDEQGKQYVANAGDRWKLVAEKGTHGRAVNDAIARFGSFLAEDNAKREAAGKPARTELTVPEKQSILDQVLDRLERWHRFEAQDDGQAGTTDARSSGRAGIEVREAEPQGTAPVAARRTPGIGSERGPTTTLTPTRRPLSAAEAKAKALKSVSG